VNRELWVLISSEITAVIRFIDGFDWVVTYEDRREQFHAVTLGKKEMESLFETIVRDRRPEVALSIPVEDWYRPERVRSVIRSRIDPVTLRPDLSAVLDADEFPPTIELRSPDHVLTLSIPDLIATIKAAEYLMSSSDSE